MTLTDFANIAQILMSVSILIALIQLIREYRGQNLESFFYLHQYLSQEDFSVARRNIRTKLCNKPYQEWSDNDKSMANRVCSSYDQAGILIFAGALDKGTVREFLNSSWGQSIIDQYEILSDYLDDKQTPTQTGREFFKHFSMLYEEAKNCR